MRSKSAKLHLSQCSHAPAKVTLMQNMKQILASEGLEVPRGNSNVCQAFGRKICLERFRPSARELEELRADQAQSASPPICSPKASRSCAKISGLPTPLPAVRRFQCRLKPAPVQGGWIRDLTAENIEPHPGPSTAATGSLKLVTWNSQGRQSIFKALAACKNA